MAVIQHKWTRDDTILILDYYYDMQKEDNRPNSPGISELHKLTGIKKGSLLRKLWNCRSLCPREEFPFRDTHFSKLHKAIYEEFKNDRAALRAEAERIKADRIANSPAL